MKSIKKSLLRTVIIVFTVFAAGTYTASAQDSGRDQEDKIKSIIDSKNYIFKANEVKPMRGISRQLSSGYDLRVFKDKLIAYLPYFGRAFSAPMDPNDAGIKFTSTHFTYSVEKHRKSWDVIINPTDAKDARQLILSIFDNGSATLQVNSINRDPVTFSGYIVQGKEDSQMF